MTPEALGRLLHEYNGRMALLSAEGDIFEIMAGRYSDDANFGVFLKGHAGDALRVNRVGRTADYVERPALTLGLCVQPDVIECLSQKPGFRARGLLGRFLYALPVSPLGHRLIDPPEIPPQAATVYQRNIMTLLSLPWNTDERGKPSPFSLRLSAEARDLLRAFQTRLEPKLAEDGELAGLTDWAGKLAGAVARIAGGLHLATVLSEPWKTPLSAETMAAAIRLGDHYTEHAKAAFCLMGADQTINAAKRILGWIVRKGCARFTRREICQELRIKSNDQTQPLDLLTDHDFVRPDAVTQPGRGRKSNGPQTFLVNPRLKS